MERRGLGLRRFLDQAVQLGSTGLVEARLVLQTQKANGLQQAQSTGGIHVGGVLGRLKAHCHMRLRTQVIDLIGLHLLQDACEVGRVSQVTVVQLELRVRRMRILIDMVNALRIEGRCPPLDAVHLVALAQQEFSQVGAVLPGDASD